MTKVKTVKMVVLVYLLGALAGSFCHIIETAHKIGLVGLEAWTVPFMIDGIVVIAMVMRSASFGRSTQRIGFRTLLLSGGLSLTANVYAAETLGGVLFGVGIVVLYVYADWLSSRLESAEAERAREAAEARTAKRREAARKGAATRRTRARSAKIRKTREAKVLDELVHGHTA